VRKILLVGDDYISSDLMKPGFSSFEEAGYKLVTADWLQGGLDKLSAVNRIVEKKGPEAEEAVVPQEIFDLIRDVEMLIVQFLPVPKALIDAGEKLRVIGTLRTGLENIDVQYATQKGIKVFNTPGRLAETVSDFTIGAIIAEARNIARGHAALKAGVWRRDYHNNDFIPELGGRTVGLVGFGAIAQAVARKLSGFNVRILAYDPYVPEERAAALSVELVDLDTLLREADFVSIHARLTEETHHLIGARELSLMKSTAILVNTARSGLVDEKALYDALKEKRIGGAFLDVFDAEPPGKDYPLITLDNCTVTPHLAGSSKDAMLNSPKRLGKAMYAQLMEGQDTGFQVNKV